MAAAPWLPPPPCSAAPAARRGQPGAGVGRPLFASVAAAASQQLRHGAPPAGARRPRATLRRRAAPPRRRLAAAVACAAGGGPPPPPVRDLFEGAEGSDVHGLQTFLVEHDFLQPEQADGCGRAGAAACEAAHTTARIA
jgi:hypothetical protein